LVNSSIEPNPENRAFISMLENMSPLDARVLHELVRAEGAPYTSMLTYELPERAHPLLDLKGVEPLINPNEDVAFSLSNLARISAITPAALWDGGVSVAQVKLTVLGRRLVRTCSGPTA
jgi:hypothetical protein